MRSGTQTKTNNPQFGDSPAIRTDVALSKRPGLPRSLGDGICQPCSELVFSPFTWAHLLGDTLNPSFPDDRSDYHVSLDIDRNTSVIGLSAWCKENAYRMFRSTPSPKKRGPVIDIYIKAGDILESVHKKCGFCTLVKQLDAAGSLLASTSETRILRLQALWPQKSNGMACPMLLEVGLHADASGGGNTWSLTFPSENTTHTKPEGLSTGMTTLSPEVDRSLQAAKRWLQLCESEHRECSNGSSNSMPKRLLDLSELGSGGEVRLVESRYLPHERYAILSYVWGSEPTLRLVSRNLVQFADGIEMRKLPMTIGHAAITTHSLGIRYLWVDALCILQDSADDKQAEIPRMSEYYTNACLVVSASGAVDAGMGFLHLIPTDRNKDVVCAARLVPFRLPVHMPEASISVCVNVTPMLYDYEGEPLNNRCWTLQESIVPRRLLTIARTGGLAMQCHAGETLVGNVVSDPFKETPSFALLGRISQGKQSADQLRELWITMVQEYTRRSLSYRQDILLAIGALARTFSSHHATALGDYVAGLWFKQLPAALLWSFKGDSPPTKSMEQGGYLAPTWSWASSAMPVTFHNTPEVYIISPYSGQAHWERKFETRWYCEVQTCNTRLKTPRDPFGAVTGGTLTIRGPLRKLQPRRLIEQGKETTGEEENTMLERSKGHLRRQSKVDPVPNFAWKDTDEKATLFALDEPFEGLNPANVAWLYSRQWYWFAVWYAGRGQARGLILEKQSSNIFKRVGFATYHVSADDFPSSNLHQEPLIQII